MERPEAECGGNLGRARRRSSSWPSARIAWTTIPSQPRANPSPHPRPSSHRLTSYPPPPTLAPVLQQPETHSIELSLTVSTLRGEFRLGGLGCGCDEIELGVVLNRMGTQPDPSSATNFAQGSTASDNHQKNEKEEHSSFDEAEKQVTISSPVDPPTWFTRLLKLTSNHKLISSDSSLCRELPFTSCPAMLLQTRRLLKSRKERLTCRAPSQAHQARPRSSRT